MIHHRTAEEVKRFDLFKLITVIILCLLFIVLWPFRPDSMRQAAEEEAATEQAAPADDQTGQSADQAVADSEPTDEPAQETAEEEAPAAESVPEIVPPTLNPLPAAAAGETITLSGTGQPDSEVEVVVDGDVVGTAPVDSQGDWAYDLPLTDAGEYDISVQAVDETGQVVGASDPLALNVAAPPISPPTVDLPDFAALAPDDKATLTGTAQPDSEVEVVVDGEVVGTAPVDSDGNWSFTLPEFTPGRYDLGLRNLDSDGNLIAEAEPTTFEWPDFNLPDVSLPPIDFPNFGSVSVAEDGTLSGTAEPGTEVEVVVDGDVVGTAPVDEDGTWSFAWPDFTPGRYDLGLRNIDSEGNVLTESEPTTFVWPDFGLPSIRLPTFDFPNFGTVTAAEDGTLSGTAEPGTEVEVVVDGDVVGTAPVDEDGNWSFTWPDFTPGRYDLGLSNIDSEGNVIAESEPTGFEWPDFGTGEAVEDTSVEPTLSLSEDSPLPGGQVMLTGTGEPNTDIEIVVDGEVVGQAPVDADGNWAFDLTLTDPGDYEISAQTVDVNGQVIAATNPATVSIAEATAESPTPTPTPAIDSTTTTTDTTTSAPPGSGDLTIIFPADEADILVGELTVTGTGPSGGDVEVLDKGTVLGTTQVGSDSEWHYTFDVVEGTLELAARLAGSQSVPDEVVDVRVVEASDSYDCASNPGLDRGATYLVGTCDTLGSIAREAGVTFADLVSANSQIDNLDLIYPGESINIPGR